MNLSFQNTAVTYSQGHRADSASKLGAQKPVSFTEGLPRVIYSAGNFTDILSLPLPEKPARSGVNSRCAPESSRAQAGRLQDKPKDPLLAKTYCGSSHQQNVSPWEKGKQVAKTMHLCPCTIRPSLHLCPCLPALPEQQTTQLGHMYVDVCVQGKDTELLPRQQDSGGGEGGSLGVIVLNVSCHPMIISSTWHPVARSRSWQTQI